MKTKTTLSDKIQKASAWIFIAAGVLLLFFGCEKSQLPPAPADDHPTEQELKVFGKWKLINTLSYEITGIDSSGALSCSLIGNETCDSLCYTQFLSQRYSSDAAYRKGLGSIGGCNSIVFAWKIKDNMQIETTEGQHFDVLSCTKDSLTISWIHKSDILNLKSVYRYAK